MLVFGANFTSSKGELKAAAETGSEHIPTSDPVLAEFRALLPLVITKLNNVHKHHRLPISNPIVKVIMCEDLFLTDSSDTADLTIADLNLNHARLCADEDWNADKLLILLAEKPAKHGINLEDPDRLYSNRYVIDNLNKFFHMDLTEEGLNAIPRMRRHLFVKVLKMILEKEI